MIEIRVDGQTVYTMYNSQTDEILRSEKYMQEMVSRFLKWRLPDGFFPDNHIEFDRLSAEKHGEWPTGTNLLDEYQARKMIEFVIFGERK